MKQAREYLTIRVLGALHIAPWSKSSEVARALDEPQSKLDVVLRRIHTAGLIDRKDRPWTYALNESGERYRTALLIALLGETEAGRVNDRLPQLAGTAG